MKLTLDFNIDDILKEKIEPIVLKELGMIDLEEIITPILTKKTNTVVKQAIEGCFDWEFKKSLTEKIEDKVHKSVEKELLNSMKKLNKER